MGTNIYKAPKYWIYRGQALPGARCDEDHLIEEETKAQESEKPAQVYKVGTVNCAQVHKEGSVGVQISDLMSTTSMPMFFTLLPTSSAPLVGPFGT